MRKNNLAYRDIARVLACVVAVLYPESAYSEILKARGTNVQSAVELSPPEKDDVLFRLWVCFVGSHPWLTVMHTARLLIETKYPTFDALSAINCNDAVWSCIAAGEIGTAAAILIDVLEQT